MIILKYCLLNKILFILILKEVFSSLGWRDGRTAFYTMASFSPTPAFAFNVAYKIRIYPVRLVKCTKCDNIKCKVYSDSRKCYVVADSVDLCDTCVFTVFDGCGLHLWLKVKQKSFYAYYKTKKSFFETGWFKNAKVMDYQT